MKNYKLTAFLVALLFTVANVAVAQYDDIYYDPDKDATYDNYRGDRFESTDRYNSRDYAEERYDDEYYEDYAYQYSSRIRRFHRPFYGFDYYDPVYIDAYYYDPFLTPGITVLIYDSPFSFNSWSRWNRWNRFNTWNNWGWGGIAYNPWNRWDRSWYYDSWAFGRPGWGMGFGGFGGYGWNSYYSNFYCPPAWGNNYAYNTVNVYNTNEYNTGYNSYYGPRKNGTSQVARNNERIYRGTETANPTPVNVNTNPGNSLDNNGRVITNPNVNPSPKAGDLTSSPSRNRQIIGANTDSDRSTATPGAATPAATTPSRVIRPSSSVNTSPQVSTSRKSTATSTPRATTSDSSADSPRRSLFGDFSSRSNSTSSSRVGSSASTRSSTSASPRLSTGSSSRTYTPSSSARSSSSSSSSRSYSAPRSSSGSSRTYTPSSSGSSSRTYSAPRSSSSGSGISSGSSGISRSSSGSSSSSSSSRSSSGSSSSPRRGGGGK